MLLFFNTEEEELEEVEESTGEEIGEEEEEMLFLVQLARRREGRTKRSLFTFMNKMESFLFRGAYFLMKGVRVVKRFINNLLKA